MARTLRAIVSLLLLAALVSPASAALCAGMAEGACTSSAAEHSCCKTPRIADCDCARSGAQQHDDAEPARREGVRAPQLTPADVPAVAILRPAITHQPAPIDTTPPLDTGGRLSLLSLLIV